VAGTTGVFTNPLDPETAEEVGFDTPAVVFFPATASTSVGGGVTLDIHAMDVDSIAGSHIQVSYNKTKLSLLSLSQGAFYEGAPEMLFYYEDDTDQGLIDIYSGFLGVDSASVSGTGQLASLVFTTISAGVSTVSFTVLSEFVDPQDNPIEILGYGSSEVVAE
jgi:hypothetical protein